MDVSIIFEPIMEFVIFFLSIELTFAGIPFTIGSVIFCLALAGIVGMFLRG